MRSLFAYWLEPTRVFSLFLCFIWARISTGSPVARFGHTATIIDSQLMLIIGGVQSINQYPRAELWTLDLGTNFDTFSPPWILLSTSVPYTAGGTACNVDGVVYVF